MAGFRLERAPLVGRWCALLFLTGLFVSALQLARIPAAPLLGTMAAAVTLGAAGARLSVPALPYQLAQAVLGCMIAGSLSPQLFRTLHEHALLYGCGVLSVIACSVLLGAALARFEVLPGTTAIWGSAPGAANVMAIMAESWGADVRLVAFMQYVRVAVVAVLASILTRVVVPEGAASPEPEWFAPVPGASLAATLGVAAIGCALGRLARQPAGALLVAMLLACSLSAAGWLTIALPRWVLAPSFALIGWSIGLRFTRDILLHAGRLLPRVLGSVLSLVAFCGGLAFAMHRVAGIDLLTAYLATSPGGADSVAIIAAHAPVDVPFVMAMQTARFVVVLLCGGGAARWVARHSPS